MQTTATKDLLSPRRGHEISKLEDDPFVKVAQLLPTIPAPTALGWIKRGVAGHKLRAVKVGRIWWTKPSYVATFIQATQPDNQRNSTGQPVRGERPVH
jgi:hypothetical protein